MKTLIIAALALSLSGCASLTGAQSQLPSQILDNLTGCSRVYTVAIGGLLPPAGSLHIQCDPVKPPVVGVVPTAEDVPSAL